MSKKIKLEVVLSIDKEINIDEGMIQRSVGLLGDIDSYNVSENLESTQTETPSQSSSTESSISEISELINSANKIYYGNLTIDQRAHVALAIFKYSNFEAISSNPGLKDKISSIFSNKFDLDDVTSKKNLEGEINSQAFEDLKNKFLDGDLTQMFIYIWEKILSSDEEDPVETELVESMQLSFGFEPASVNEIKKQGNDRAKINKSINIIKSGNTAYNKLKAFEKTVLIGLMLGECSRVDGQISSDNQSRLRSILSNQFGITANATSVILEIQMDEPITKKVEQVEVYREKYDLVEFVWEKILSTEDSLNDDEMELIRKWLRRIDISDVESQGARRDAMEALNPK
jgi:uncharacterized tellurite resistance protein B-like protein